MPTDKYVAYYRVSTQRQGRSGLGLKAQRDAVQALVNRQGGRLLEEITEVESGKRNDRRELRRAICRAKVSGARLIITKLDRLSDLRETIADIVATGSLSNAAIAAELNRREIEAPRGGRWHPMGVARLRQRLQPLA